MFQGHPDSVGFGEASHAVTGKPKLVIIFNLVLLLARRGPCDKRRIPPPLVDTVCRLRAVPHYAIHQSPVDITEALIFEYVQSGTLSQTVQAQRMARKGRCRGRNPEDSVSRSLANTCRQMVFQDQICNGAPLNGRASRPPTVPAFLTQAAAKRRVRSGVQTPRSSLRVLD